MKTVQVKLSVELCDEIASCLLTAKRDAESTLEALRHLGGDSRSGDLVHQIAKIHRIKAAFEALQNI